MKILLLLLIIFLSKDVFPQWTQTNGPFGGAVNCLATGSNSKGGINLYAGSGRGGIYISSDTAKSWNYSAIGLSVIEVYSVAVKDSIVFAAANTNGCFCAVFMSTDYGKSWTESGLRGHYVSSFAFSGNNVIAGTWDGIFLSTNNGISWSASNSGMPNYKILSLASAGKNIFAGTENGRILFSTDNGKNWKQLSTGLSGNDINAIIVRDTNIYAGADNGYIFLSANNGAGWTALNIGVKSADITSLAVKDSSIFAGTYLGVFHSTDNGKNWEELNNGFTISWEYNFVRSLVMTGTNILAAAGNGIFLSTNNGTLWAPANTGLINTRITALAATGSGIFAGAEGCGIFFSADSGQSWKEMNSGLINPYPIALASSGNKIAVATYGGIYISIDNGNIWAEVNKGLLPDTSAFPAIAMNDTVIYAGSIENGVFLSTNNGQSWKSVSIGLSGNAMKIRTLALKGNNLFAGTEDGVYLLTGSATNWKPVNNGLIYSTGVRPIVNTLVISENNILAGVDKGIFLSTDNGTNWKAINNGLFIDSLGDVPGVISIAARDSNIFAGTDAFGVFHSIDTGAVWKKANEGFPDSLQSMQVPALAISGKNLFAVLSNSGLWMRPVAEAKAMRKLYSETLPHKFSLGQNYPNPFNPSTTIIFSLPYSAHVTLKIFDLLGHEVETLLDEEKPAGVYQSVWQAYGISSGVYFYEIKAGSFIQTRKMVLLR